jgi:hypothetical protein
MPGMADIGKAGGRRRGETGLANSLLLSWCSSLSYQPGPSVLSCSSRCLILGSGWLPGHITRTCSRYTTCSDMFYT